MFFSIPDEFSVKWIGRTPIIDLTPLGFLGRNSGCRLPYFVAGSGKHLSLNSGSLLDGREIEGKLFYDFLECFHGHHTNSYSMPQSISYGECINLLSLPSQILKDLTIFRSLSTIRPPRVLCFLAVELQLRCGISEATQNDFEQVSATRASERYSETKLVYCFQSNVRNP